MTKNNNKKNKTVLDDIILPNVRLGTQTSVNTLVGKDITLNQKKESFVGVGPIWLTPENYTIKIPEGMKDEDYTMLGKLIGDGTLVLGDHLVPPVDKTKDVLDEYWNKLSSNNIDNTTKFPENAATRTKFLNLFRRGSDRNWGAHEIITFCLEKETKTKKRKNVIQFLEELKNSIAGPLSYYTPPSKPTDTESIIIDSENQQAIKVKADGTREVVNGASANRVEIPSLSPEATQLLNNLLSARR